jgi:hypothetical protein
VSFQAQLAATPWQRVASSPLIADMVAENPTMHENLVATVDGGHLER